MSLIPFRLPQIICFTLSVKCFSCDSDSCPDVGIGPLLQFPHPLRAGPILLTLLFPRLVRSQKRLNDFTSTFHLHALEKEMATYSSVLAWRIPVVGEPGELTSMGLHRVRHDWSDLAAAAAASVLPSFAWVYMFFSAGQVLLSISAGVLRALLCLKVYS